MTRVLLLLAAILFISRAAWADARPLVIFFGGHGATQDQMRSWKAKAKADPKYGKIFEFQSVAYPKGATSDEKDAVARGTAVVNEIANSIAAQPNRQFVIVGHSSGAALAAKVIEKVRIRKNLKLMILDDGIDTGLPPLEGFNRANQMQCWSASNSKLSSLNINDAKKLCGPETYHEIKSPECKTSYCLHFKLVNEGADANLNDKTYAKKGYSHLRPNLRWLDFATPEHSAAKR